MSALLITGGGSASTSNNALYASCNGMSSSVSLTSANGALQNSISASGSTSDGVPFSNRIKYRFNINTPDAGGTLVPEFLVQDQAAGYNVTTAKSAFHHRISVSADVHAADNADRRPISGTYTDTVTILLTAA